MRTYALIFAFLLLLVDAGSSMGGEVAIIVNKENPLESVSMQDLAQIFKSEKKDWPNGGEIHLVFLPADYPEKEVVLKTIYKMDANELKKFWLAKIYQGRAVTFPKTFASSEAIKKFVSLELNSVGFIDAAAVDDSIKVLKVEGIRPGQQGYAIKL